MDIERFKRLSIPKIEAGKMTEVVRDVIKEVRTGSGVVYYNNPADLLDRLELLGGSILAGNNGVKNEFSKIAHIVNKLSVLNNNQLYSLLKEYVI